jgi:hypothetical protein
MVPSRDVPAESAIATEKTREDGKDKILTDCEEFLQDSWSLGDLAILKAIGKTKTGQINPFDSTKRWLRVGKGRTLYGVSNKRNDTDNTKTEGIEESEIERRKIAGECYWCAWPSDRKATHMVKDCIRPIELDK